MNPDEVLHMIDNGCLDIEKTTPRDSTFPLRGSAIGKCPRQLAMLLAGKKKRALSPKALRIFSLGNGRGEHLAAALDKSLPAEVETHLEMPVFAPLPAINTSPADAMLKIREAFGDHNNHGVCRIGETLYLRSRCDFVGIDTVPNPGHLHLVEFKTGQEYAIKKAKQDGLGDDYKAQVLCQRRGLQEEYGDDYKIATCVLVYESKQTQELTAFPVEQDDHFLNAYLTQVAEVLDQWLLGFADGINHSMRPSEKTGALPWQCNYCNIGPLEGRCFDEDLLIPKTVGDMVKWSIRRDDKG